MSISKEERAAARQQLSAAGSLWVNRAVGAAWRKLAAAAKLFRKAKLAAASFLHRNLRKGINAWSAMMAERAR